MDCTSLDVYTLALLVLFPLFFSEVDSVLQPAVPGGEVD